jgi:hypothetical protein
MRRYGSSTWIRQDCSSPGRHRGTARAFQSTSRRPSSKAHSTSSGWTRCSPPRAALGRTDLVLPIPSLKLCDAPRRPCCRRKSARNKRKSPPRMPQDCWKRQRRKPATDSSTQNHRPTVDRRPGHTLEIGDGHRRRHRRSSAAWSPGDHGRSTT